ncbi:MAG: hypothetical protein KF729_37220 [Sandaracinaceae bacterium]|nr:hypothetical protein [Sandaracinaceae bacterium]
MGPPVLVGDGPGGRALCGGGAAERAFRYALCACRGVSLSTPLETASFDSRRGPFAAPGGSGAAVGVNGALELSSPMRFGGSLWVAGPEGVRAPSDATPVSVAGELRSGGAYASGSALEVGLDARVAGDVTAASLVVGGALVTPAGATVSAASVTAAERRTEPVVVAPPCDCDPSVLLDVGALVRARERDHDDARAGLAPASLADYRGDVRVELPCGRYYFDRVAGDGALTFVVTGRAAVYVAGDLAPGGPLRVEIGEAAELDLFVQGTLTSTADVTFGEPAHPARARLYLGGDGAVTLTGTSVLAGNVYAPRADVSTSGALDVYGSLFVGRLSASGGVRVFYDTAVLDAGADCPADPAPCTSCRDCRNQACVDGACGACRNNDDCCSPLLCIGGRCQAEPF